MSRGSQRGFTLIEIMLAIVIAPLIVAAVTKVVMASKVLAASSRADLHAHEELRKNLESIVDVIRDADVETFSGFDAKGNATHPTFQCVLGVGQTGRIYEGTEELFWRPVMRDVDGVASPGEVVHRRGGVEQVVARNVPAGGFTVFFESGMLVIRVTSYYSTSEREVARATGTTAVALRN